MQGGSGRAYILGWRRRQLRTSGSGSGGELSLYVRRDVGGKKAPPELIHPSGGSLGEKK